MADFKKAIKFSLDGVEQSIKNVGELAKFLKDAKKGVDSLDDTKLAGLRDSLNEVESQLGEVSKKNENLTKSFTDFTKTVNTKIPVNSIKNFKVQLADLEDQLEGLEVGSDAFKKIKKEADTLKTALETIEQNASETRQQFVDLGKGIAESLVSSVGTFKLFTSGQEEADKITAKFAETLALVETVEKAAIAVKEIDKFITTQAALATTAVTAATVANTAATTTNTAATGIATTVQSGLNTAYNATIGTLKKLYVVLLANPITAITAIVATAAAAWYAYGETAQEALDKAKKAQEEELALFEKKFEKQKLLNAKAREEDKKLNDIDRIRKQYEDEIKELEFFVKQKDLVDAKLEERRKLAEKLKFADKNKELREIEGLQLDADNRFLAAEVELQNKKRDFADFDIDLARASAALLEDIELEKLNSKKTFTDEFIINDKQRNKELKDLKAEFDKEEIKNLVDYENKKLLINTKYNNIELGLKQQLTDRLTDLNRKKEDSELARTLKFSQIKTSSFVNDQQRQEAAIRKQREIDDKRAKEDLEKSLNELGDLTTASAQKVAKGLIADYDEQLKNNKDFQDEQLKISKEGIDARYNEEKIAQQLLVDISREQYKTILDDTKKSYDDRIFANNVLLDSTIENIELQRDILLQDKTLTEDQVKAINAKAELEIDNAKKIVKAQNTIFEGRKKLFKSEAQFDAFVKGTEQIEESLTNIAALGLDTKINSIIQSIASSTGAVKTLSQSLDEIGKKDYDKLFGEFADENKLADQTKAYGQAAIAITASINSAIQAVTDAQLTDLDTKLAKIQELKDKIDEDLDKTREDIRDLQSNLAEAQLEDRERLIKKIAKQRAAEKALADQKQKAIQDEIALNEKKKQLQKDAFIANKIASGIQAAINTAVAITAALTNPVTAPVLVPIIAGLGAIQIAAIAAAPIPEFATGGFTEKGDKNDVAGVVHKGEWIAPKWMVESPKFNGVINELESNRQQGFATGGFVSASNNTAILQEIREQNKVLSAVVDRPVVVSVQEINSVNSTVKRTQVKSTLN